MGRRAAIRALGLKPESPNAAPTEQYAQTTAELVERVEAMRARMGARIVVEARVREAAIRALGLKPESPNAAPTERYAQTTAELVERVEAMRARMGVVEARVRE